MLPANTYVIRQATVDDERALRGLAELDSQRPLDGPVLIGEIDGRAAAAISLADGRAVADPFQFTVHLRQACAHRSGPCPRLARPSPSRERRT